MKQAGTAILFLILGILLVPAFAWIYLSYGHPPVAVADPSFPMEAAIVHNPLHHRIDAELPGASPMAINDITLAEGASVYMKDCSFCHGVPGTPSRVGSEMYPSTPQLWVKHRRGNVVGVSDDPAGETYWKVKNGIRLTGMPSYVKILTDQQLWEVSNLLSTADKPMPSAVATILSQTPR